MKTLFPIAIFFLLAATGCQQEQVSLHSWQDSVEHYIWDQANGDASVLRDLPTPGNWKSPSDLPAGSNCRMRVFTFSRYRANSRPPATLTP